ncbi:MAG: succinate dehydrogenase cytochrome b subunit [Planctomycetes bacterium]|nr:succinate dehydrogenase cytochrome b subunit [Planctomycetota bacterium]
MTWLRSLWQSTIGKKVVMAVTGLILFGFVIGHLLGNMQVLLPDGARRINHYSRFLHENAGLLWGARATLLIALILHLITSLQLTLRNRKARPEPYRVKRWREASYASRTMMLSGPIIFFYIVYHLAHLTTGQAHPDFNPDDVYRNLVIGFGVWWASGAYIVAQILIAMHISHGAWSMFQSVGLNHPLYTPPLKMLARVLAIGIAAGYISIPVAVMTGLVT